MKSNSPKFSLIACVFWVIFRSYYFDYKYNGHFFSLPLWQAASEMAPRSPSTDTHSAVESPALDYGKGPMAKAMGCHFQDQVTKKTMTAILLSFAHSLIHSRGCCPLERPTHQRTEGCLWPTAVKELNHPPKLHPDPKLTEVELINAYVKPLKRGVVVTQP